MPSKEEASARMHQAEIGNKKDEKGSRKLVLLNGVRSEMSINMTISVIFWIIGELRTILL